MSVSHVVPSSSSAQSALATPPNSARNASKMSFSDLIARNCRPLSDGDMDRIAHSVRDVLQDVLAERGTRTRQRRWAGHMKK